MLLELKIEKFNLICDIDEFKRFCCKNVCVFKVVYKLGKCKKNLRIQGFFEVDVSESVECK